MPASCRSLVGEGCPDAVTTETTESAQVSCGIVQIHAERGMNERDGTARHPHNTFPVYSGSYFAFCLSDGFLRTNFPGPVCFQNA